MKTKFIFYVFWVNIVFYSCTDEETKLVSEVNEMKNYSVEEAFPGQPGEIKSFAWRDHSLYYKEVKGYKVFQGDILLSEKQLGLMKKGAGSNASAPDADINMRWPNSTVYYKVEISSQASAINTAINHIKANTNIDFIPTTGTGNYIAFVQGDGCSSYVGMQYGRQIITLSPSCSVGSIIHEICHALGIWHEQSRPDRNTYVNINQNNILSGHEFNFDIAPSYNYGNFDFNSIMMYGPYSFSKNGLPTITKKNGSVYTIQRNGLSSTDINALLELYPVGLNSRRSEDVGANKSGDVFHIVKNRTSSVYRGTVSLGGNQFNSRIDVHPNGTPYAISTTSIQYYSNNKWNSLDRPAGTLLDIGIGDNGNIYVISQNRTNSDLYRKSGSSWIKESGISNPEKVTIDGFGNLWVVANSTDIFTKRNGSWIKITRPSSGNILDIGASDKFIYVIVASRSGLNGIYKYSSELDRFIEQESNKTSHKSLDSGQSGYIWTSF